MNERIKELELQSYVEITHNLIDPASNYMQEVTVKEFSREKFAELIIQNVCNLILHYANVDEGVAVAKKQFGVE